MSLAIQVNQTRCLGPDRMRGPHEKHISRQNRRQSTPASRSCIHCLTLCKVNDRASFIQLSGDQCSIFNASCLSVLWFERERPFSTSLLLERLQFDLRFHCPDVRCKAVSIAHAAWTTTLPLGASRFLMNGDCSALPGNRPCDDIAWAHVPIAGRPCVYRHRCLFP